MPRPRKIKLSVLLDGLVDELNGDRATWVDHITIDWREVREGSLYIARPGWYLDGHDKISEALEAGASAVVLVDKAAAPVECGVPVAWVREPDPFLALVSDRFYGSPTRELKVFGVTGTNGKTSVTYLLEAALSALGERVAVMGTIDYRVDGRVLMAATNTTPDALVIQRFARHALEFGATALVLEVSSHALAIGRAHSIAFDCVGFTNLSQDHLDFHGSMASYRAVKARLFADSLSTSLAMGKEPAAVACVDADGEGARMLECVPDGVGRLAVRLDGGLPGLSLHLVAEHGLDGMEIELAVGDASAVFSLPLLGAYNLWNVGLAVGMALGPAPDADSLRTVAQAMEGLAPLPGRLERVGRAGTTAAFVDYAHTPDAVAKVLALLRPLGPRLTVVLGCGGDRDVTKRPRMARAAVMGATEVVFTSDNPRSEVPGAILDAMMAGLTAAQAQKVHRVEDRREAIALGVKLAGEGPLLVAGKGHETTQEVDGRRRHFDDREVLRAALDGSHPDPDPVVWEAAGQIPRLAF